MNKHVQLAIFLSLIALSMFSFGYALVPLYNVLCKNLGFNGKPLNKATAPTQRIEIDTTRTITIQFLTTNNKNIPWDFYPQITTLHIHPGQNTRVMFYAKNKSDHTMTVQAIPSVTPGRAAAYLKKTECFCFAQQTLKSQSELTMPLLFHIDRELPPTIHTVTLSYTLFDVTGNSAIQKKVSSDRIGRLN